MYLKDGVVLALSEPMAKALPVIEKVYERTITDRKKFFVVTSAKDGKHMVGSKHYTGDAIDIRTRDLSGAESQILWRNLANTLGNDFDVVLEPDHIHVEYDPD